MIRGADAGSTFSKVLSFSLVLLLGTVLVATFMRSTPSDVADSGAPINAAPSDVAESGAPINAAPAHAGLNFLGQPDFRLSDDEQTALDSGDLVIQRKTLDRVERGSVVRDIAAPPEVVFAEVAAVEKYVGRVPMLCKLQVYHDERHGAWRILKAQYTSGVLPGYTYNNFIEHHINAERMVLNLGLDTARESESDFEKMSGRWVIEAHPKKSGWGRAYYQVELKFPRLMPGFVKSFVIKTALHSAMGWVKAASEGTAMPAAGSVSATSMAVVSVAVVVTLTLCGRGARHVAVRMPRLAAAPVRMRSVKRDAAADPLNVELGSAIAPSAS